MQDSLTLIQQDSFGNYLFALHPSLTLNPSMSFQVPSYPARQDFEFSMLANGTGETVNINVYLKKHFEKSPYTTLTLPADNSWHKFKLVSPKTKDKVRPLFFNFKFPSKTSILIKTGN